MHGASPASRSEVNRAYPLQAVQGVLLATVKRSGGGEKSQDPLRCASDRVRGKPQSTPGDTESVPRVCAAPTSIGRTAVSSAPQSLASALNGSVQSSRFLPPPAAATSPSAENLQRSSGRCRSAGTGTLFLPTSSVSLCLSVTSPTIPVSFTEQKSCATTAGGAASSAQVASEAASTKKPLCIRKRRPVKKSDGSQGASLANPPLPENSTTRTVYSLPHRWTTESGVKSPPCEAQTRLSPSRLASPALSESAAGEAEAMELNAVAPVMPQVAVLPQLPSAPPSAPPSKGWSAPMHTHGIPEHLPTDDPDVLVPAHKYVYDLKTCTWKGVSAMIRVLHPNRGLSQGEMRVCFPLEEVDEAGFRSLMVAKMFRHNISNVTVKDYFNEGESQCICGIFAERFNRAQASKDVQRHVVSFLQCETLRIKRCDIPEAHQHKRTGFFSYHPTDSADIFFTMEPRLDGFFTKYTSNFGGVYEGFERPLSSEEERRRHGVLLAVEAFSHFTLEESGGSMLVSDLQGVHDFLTDPQIHTEDGKGFGMGNMGREGIGRWREAHVCNEVCTALKLKPLSKDWRGTPSVAENENRTSYYEILRAKLRSSALAASEEILPLPEPLSDMCDDERLEYAMRLSALVTL
ncbi:hypothetical protein JKF63_00730 [Porcisia hertigi]|uniref:Alpha-type protein kinase domain-containing protein n=1 Tax=Porcisia hertigi TaxID=2761500 RepID=A0A836KXF7_9TRYP|nr:hypothetical protein JKF63_00730 [Porcisia hertigi]